PPAPAWLYLACCGETVRKHSVRNAGSSRLRLCMFGRQLSIDQDIALSGARADEAVIEPFSASAYPGAESGGRSYHKGKRGQVSRHHSTCRNHCVFADGHTANDGCVGTDGCTQLHVSRPEFILPLDEGARRNHIGENRTRPAEHVVFQRYSLIKRNIV